MNQTLGSLVAAQPNLAPLMEGLGLDFCCGGHRTLEEAAREKGLDPRTLGLAFEALGRLPLLTNPPAVANPAFLPTRELIDHIISVHHSFVRKELPRLVELSKKVAVAHGPDHPELVLLESSMAQFSAALSAHLEEEEASLFPVLRDLSPGPHPLQSATSLAPYFSEHEEAGSHLAEFRTLTQSFLIPDWACPTYRRLMEGLDAFEKDLHHHIHLENNVLFRRFTE